MDIVCKFPLCKRHPEKNGYCISHRIYASEPSSSQSDRSKPVTAKKKPIARFSEKRQKLQVKYNKLVKEMLADNKMCEIKSPDCTGVAEGLHHIEKRSARNLLDKTKLKRSCNYCNTFVENNVSWAEKKGFIISKHKKTKNA